jgi:hypothetical protein
MDLSVRIGPGLFESKLSFRWLPTANAMETEELNKKRDSSPFVSTKSTPRGQSGALQT